MAAALALRGRQLGRRVLVVTVDPAKRLASALGLDLTGVEERLVPASEVSRPADKAVRYAHLPRQFPTNWRYHFP